MQQADNGIKPTTIPDESIPLLNTSELNKNSTSSDPTGGRIVNESVSPKEIPNAQATTSPIAQEVVSTALDTLRRRINGLFRIGKVGGIADVNGKVIADRYGLNSINQFTNGTIAVTAQATSNAAFIDVPGATITFTLPRAANVLVLVNATVHGSDCTIALNVDTVNQADTIKTPANTPGNTNASSFLLSLAAGPHTIKLQFLSQTGAAVTIDRASITYISLGK